MLTQTQQEMVALFEAHVGAELAGDLDTTLATMGDNPHLNHVPTRAGGYGRAGVYDFYRNHLVGRFFPPDVKMDSLSRTVGESAIVEEIYITFTHTAVVDWLLPGVAPTGRPVEVVAGWVERSETHPPPRGQGSEHSHPDEEMKRWSSSFTRVTASRNASGACFRTRTPTTGGLRWSPMSVTAPPPTCHLRMACS